MSSAITSNPLASIDLYETMRTGEAVHSKGRGRFEIVAPEDVIRYSAQLQKAVSAREEEIRKHADEVTDLGSRAAAAVGTPKEEKLRRQFDLAVQKHKEKVLTPDERRALERVARFGEVYRTVHQKRVIERFTESKTEEKVRDVFAAASAVLEHLAPFKRFDKSNFSFHVSKEGVVSVSQEEKEGEAKLNIGRLLEQADRDWARHAGKPSAETCLSDEKIYAVLNPLRPDELDVLMRDLLPESGDVSDGVMEALGRKYGIEPEMCTTPPEFKKEILMRRIKCFALATNLMTLHISLPDFGLRFPSDTTPELTLVRDRAGRLKSQINLSAHDREKNAVIVVTCDPLAGKIHQEIRFFPNTDPR